MAFEGPQAGDIRATLALSQAEAQVGSSRTLTLPGGRRITVPIRAGIRDGEEIRLKGQGEETWPGGPVGDLILTVSLPTVEQYAQQPFYGDNPGSPTDFIAPPPLPPFATYASPSGATYPATGSYPNYPEQANAQATANVLGTSTAQANTTATAQASATAAASATASALQTVLSQATSGTPALNDQLSAPSNNYNWDQLTSSNSTVGGSCTYTGGAYHSNMPRTSFFQPCFAETPTYGNFAFQVQMTITQGDEGGIIFRADPANSKFYLFRISQSGAYDLFLYVDNQGSHAKNLLSNSSSLIKMGQNQTNTITVVARGANIYFFINSQYLDGVSNGMFSSGKIGVFGESNTHPTDVAFSNAQVWQQ